MNSNKIWYPICLLILIQCFVETTYLWETRRLKIVKNKKMKYLALLKIWSSEANGFPLQLVALNPQPPPPFFNFPIAQNYNLLKTAHLREKYISLNLTFSNLFIVWYYIWSIDWPFVVIKKTSVSKYKNDLFVITKCLMIWKCKVKYPEE